jgi:aquaporin Z
MSNHLSVAALLRSHWPEYLIEAWALGMFMISASVFTTLFEYPGSPLHTLVHSADVRRAVIGIAMGLTAVGLIYSPWGKRSGAHMNPAVTLAFLSLGRISIGDAVFYILAQFVGGALGVYLSLDILGDRFASPPVSYVVTMPGESGVVVAFIAEVLISFGLLWVVLTTASRPRFAKFAGLAAGCLVALYITFEAPVSGMSMNPARTLASALPSESWSSLWLYFTAPVLGMWAAARVYAAGGRERPCAKLRHTADVCCIHCGHTPL